MKPLGFFKTLAMLVVAVVVSACGSDPDALLKRAEERAAKGDYAAAIVDLKAVLQQQPANGLARHRLGSLYLLTFEDESAAKELRQASELGVVEGGRVILSLGRALQRQGKSKEVLDSVKPVPAFESGIRASMHALRGHAHLSLGQIGQAREEHAFVTKLDPNNSDGELLRARLTAEQRDFQNALAIVENALGRDAANLEAWTYKVDLLALLKKRDAMMEAYEQVLRIHPTFLGALAGRAIANLTARKPELAQKDVDTLRRFHPRHPVTSLLQGYIHIAQGKFREGLELGQTLLKTYPEFDPARLLVGMAHFSLGSVAQAEQDLSRFVSRHPGNVQARRLLIASALRNGQTQRALDLLEPLLKKDPDSALLALAGEAHLQMSEFGKATTYLERAIALDPSSVAMHTALGMSRLAAGEIELGTADLDAAAKLDPSRQQAFVLLIGINLRLQRFDQALKAAQEFVHAQPKNPLAYNLLAAAHRGKKDVGAARKALEHALSLQPNFVPAANNLAMLDLDAGDPAAARKRLQAIIANDRHNAQALMALATLGPRIGASSTEIRAWLESAHKASAGDIRPLITLIQFHLAARDAKSALTLAEQGLASAPDKIELLQLVGQAQIEAGERHRAVVTFNRLVALQPDSPQALLRLASAQNLNADLSAAAASARKALALRPNTIEGQLLLADIEIKRGEIASALAIAADLKRHHPKSPLGWTVEGDIRMRERKYPLAVKAFEQAHALLPSLQTVVRLHAALALDGRAAEGEGRMLAWLKLHPDDFPARFYLAEAFSKADKYKAASEQYEVLAVRYPKDVMVLNNLAWSYLQSGDRRAVEAAERALKQAPNNPAAMDTLGLALIQQGDLKRGVAMLKEAAQRSPKSPEIRFNYVRGLVKLGDKALAKSELERLLADYPKLSDGKDATHILALLK